MQDSGIQDAGCGIQDTGNTRWKLLGLSRIVRGAEEAFRTGEFVGGAGKVSHLPALVIGGTTEVGTIISLRVAERPATGFDTPLTRLAERTDYTPRDFFYILWSHL